MIEIDILAVHLDPKLEECLRDMVEGKFKIIFSLAVCCLSKGNAPVF